MSDNTNLDISILERAVAGFDLVLTDTQKQSFLTYYQLLICLLYTSPSPRDCS